MKRDERQNRIVALLASEAGLSASELARYFQVSRMTIHRDLQSLLNRGALRRIHGGAVARIHDLPAGGFCSVCAKRLLPHQQSQIITADGAKIFACCAGCGLRHFLTLPNAQRLLVGDQISGQMIAAEEAFFLANSQASPCCQPSLLSFDSENDVTLFQAGFGGVIARLDEAVEFLRVAESLGQG